MTCKRVDAASITYIPHFNRVVEAAGNYSLPLSVEVQRYDLGSMSEQRVQTLPALHIPQSGGVVHRARRDHGAMGVEGQTHYFRRVPSICVIKLASLCIPQLTRFIFIHAQAPTHRTERSPPTRCATHHAPAAGPYRCRRRCCCYR